jgi:putative hydrolase of the HAD superfamily
LNTRRARQHGDSRRASSQAATKRGRKLKVVLFDYGGTLFKSDRPWAAVRAEGMASAYAVLREGGLAVSAEKFAESCDSIFAKYSELEAKEDRDIADRIKYQEVIDTLLPKLSQAKRIKLAMAANRAFWATAVRDYPIRKSAQRALRHLESRGLRMAVVSNHHNYESLVSHLEEAGIHSHFEIIFASEREGIRKPNAAIFAKSLKAMGVKKEHALFVGDSPRHDIVGARAAGIAAVLIDDGEELEGWRIPAGGLSIPEARPDFVIKDLLELREIVDSILGQKQSIAKRAKAT